MLPAMHGYAAHLFHKDGAITECTIVDENARTTVVRLKDGTKKVYAAHSILRILYTDLELGKVYVRKTNGESIAAYLVDEDRNSYTFRKKLYAPVEFSLKRKDVLFITRSNPSNLRARAMEDRVLLSWNEPYQPPASYAIYMKTSEEAEYTLAAKSSDSTREIPDLTKGTHYYFIVKAVDSKGNESLPSNQITVFTDIPPAVPQHLQCAIQHLPHSRLVNARLSWQQAPTLSTPVTTYHIYRKAADKVKRIGKTSATSYIVNSLDPDKNHYFFIRSVDRNGNESDNSNLASTEVTYQIMLKTAYLMPRGAYQRLVKNGYGATLILSLPDTFLPHMNLGVEAGCWHFKGNAVHIAYNNLFPCLFTLSYSFPVCSWLRIMPLASAGIAYNVVRYDTDGVQPLEKAEFTTERSIDPLLKAEILLSLPVTEYFALNGGAEYVALYEEDGPLYAIAYTLGGTIRF